MVLRLSGLGGVSSEGPGSRVGGTAYPSVSREANAGLSGRREANTAKAYFQSLTLSDAFSAERADGSSVGDFSASPDRSAGVSTRAPWLTSSISARGHVHLMSNRESHHLPPRVMPLRTAPFFFFPLHLRRPRELLMRLPAASDDASSGRGGRFPKGNIRDLDGWWAITPLIPPGHHSSLLLWAARHFQTAR